LECKQVALKPDRHIIEEHIPKAESNVPKDLEKLACQMQTSLKQSILVL